ncbi:hypothetical protein ACFWBI_19170 [Streptomyces sp. NPDC059982]|uniref:hypothetical protein n=1 Tax=unclassified Streptomyces TaxID=2593676 RepID=UPI00369C3F3B
MKQPVGAWLTPPAAGSSSPPSTRTKAWPSRALTVAVGELGEVGSQGARASTAVADVVTAALALRENTAAGASSEEAHPAIRAWAQGGAAKRGTNELSLGDLKAVQQT